MIFVLNLHISCQSLEHLKEKKENNKNKNPVSCNRFNKDVSFVSRVNIRGNLITAPAEFDVAFDFAIYLWSQKYNRQIERSKNLPKCFSLMLTFYIFSVQNLSCFHVANFVADGKIFYSRSTLPENFFFSS